jgi:hypothetical protein
MIAVMSLAEAHAMISVTEVFRVTAKAAPVMHQRAEVHALVAVDDSLA